MRVLISLLLARPPKFGFAGDQTREKFVSYLLALKKDGMFQAMWPPELMLKDNKRLSMAFLELYPIVVSATCCGDQSG